MFAPQTFTDGALPIGSTARESGENVSCGIDISVVVCPTIWAVPLPVIKRQFIDNMTAVSTAFRTGKPSVNLYQCATIPLTFVLQLTNQLAPATISNRLSQLVIFHHVLHRQVLNRNHLVFAYQLSRQLVQKIFAGVGNLSLNSCHRPSCFISIFRAFDATRQNFLSLSQLKTKAFKVKRIGYLLTVTGGNQRRDSNIYSNPFVRGWQSFNRWVFNQQGDKPSPRGVQPHCYSGRLNPLGKSPAPPDGQVLSTFRQPELPVLPLEGGTSELSAASTTLLFEVRILGSSCPEGKQMLSEGFSIPAEAERS